MATKKIPTIQDVVSHDLNYEVWAPIVKTKLVEKGVWNVVKYGIPPDRSKIPELAAKIQLEDLSRWRDFVGKDMEALQILQSSLPDSVFRMTLTTTSSKHLWDLLKEANEQQAKSEKKFEQEKMKEGERSISSSQSKQDCSSMDSKRIIGSRHERGDYNNRNNELPEYQMLAINIGHVTFDEDMWMIYTTTTNHMTPYITYFTNLDRTYRAKIRSISGSTIMSEGMGDVMIMTKEGKETIKNVLFVPGINRNVLSVPQMTQRGYRILFDCGNHKCTINDQAGKLFAEPLWDDERCFFLRLQVVEGNYTY